MPTNETVASLPSYDNFAAQIAVLHLPISASELHGILWGYLCAGVPNQAEAYLRALMIDYQKNKETKEAALAMFDIFAISQQQLAQFYIQLLLPDDDMALTERARAFSEWCEGFTQSLTIAGVSISRLHEEDSQDALLHIQEFAQLDYDTLDVSEDDEKAFVEVSEYARAAVLQLHLDLNEDQRGRKDGQGNKDKHH